MGVAAGSKHALSASRHDFDGGNRRESVDGSRGQPRTVYDVKTRLSWQQSASTGTSTWAGSKTYCERLNLDGTGWRLPTIQELQTIVDETQIGPAIDPTAFPSQPDSDFWTSTPWGGGGSGSAWKVDFHDGSTNIYDINALYPIRCVR